YSVCWSLVCMDVCIVLFFFFSSRRRHTRSKRDWSSDVCSSDLAAGNTTLWVLVLTTAGYVGVVALSRQFSPFLARRSCFALAGEIGRASCRERGEIGVGAGGGGGARKTGRQ